MRKRKRLLEDEKEAAGRCEVKITGLWFCSLELSSFHTARPDSHKSTPNPSSVTGNKTFFREL